jgi:2-polyprenyl-6-hydroxyphenyl methylase/3-demethylubiquinone-9 3-methyltransferase
MFAFGANWSRFLGSVDRTQIEAAKRSLLRLLDDADLTSTKFLDAGSGSGLFSLAASELGAKVVSIDIDPQSVACTNEMRNRYGNDVGDWSVAEASLLDRDFLADLGLFDVVYCWGVAHHTGEMWNAIENVSNLVAPNGTLVLAIYNDELYVSDIWKTIKRLYNRLPAVLRPIAVLGVGGVGFLKRFVVTAAASAFRLATLRNPLSPFLNWIHDSRGRGMHCWYDLVDWVGGWPFEVAKPEEVFRVLKAKDFLLSELTTSQGHGCNEFVFIRSGG